MKKNIIYYGLFSLIFFLPSCLRTEADLFDESAALRLNHAIASDREALLSAANGWIMEYFPDNEQAGITFWVKFGENDMATIAAKSGSAYNEAIGAWNVIGDNGPVLTFDTYNDVFHVYSDPVGGGLDKLGVGWGGDYEFIILSASDDFIQLKGKKRGTDVRLYRLDENQDWKDYFTLSENMDALLFSKTVSVNLNLTVGDKVYTLQNGASHIFTLPAESEEETEESESTSEIPFIVTDYGIRFAKPFEVGDQAVQTFKLSDDKNSLICIDENVNAEIIGPDPSSFFNEKIDDNKRWSLLDEDNSLSPLVKAAYDRLVQAFKSRNLTLGQVSYIYSGRNNTNAVYIASTSGASGYLYFDKEAIAEGVKYTFKESFDNNGRTFYNNYDGTSDLIQLMSGSFKIEVASSKLNPSKIKLTNIDDTNIWFTVFLQ